MGDTDVAAGERRATGRTAGFAVAVTIFFLSGVAALAYQVIWQRLLVIFSGADIYSVTLIVTAYMGGLGMGSFAGGRVADRLGPSRSLAAFAAVELLIGAFGLASKWLYYDVLYQRVPELATEPAIAAVVLFISLLWPTLLMGMSLPLLARALTTSIARVGRVVGSLYGWNTVGAAAGAFVTTWVLLPRFGLAQSLWIAAAINGLCAAAALMLVRQKTDGAAAQSRVALAEAEAATLRAPLPFAAWVLIYGVTGFIALSLEIVWFRILSVMLKSTAFTFGTLLAVYLGGFGLGAAAGARRVGRSVRPGAVFLWLQLGVLLYTAAAIVALLASIGAGHPIKLVRYLGEYEPVDVYRTLSLLRGASLQDLDALGPVFDFAILYLVIPAVLIGPATFLMGYSVPYLQQATHAELAHVGRRVGTLLASNIGGSMAGAALTGAALLPLLGTAGTLRLLVASGAMLAIPLAQVQRRMGTRRASTTLLATVCVAAIAFTLLPDRDTLWARLHGTTPQRAIVGEDGAGLSLLKSERVTLTGQVGVFVNGLGQSWIPFGNIHTALGALPVLLHPAPVDVLVIGLGSGDTAFAAAGRPEVRQLMCVEIIGAQLPTLRELARVQGDPGLRALLSDARIEHHTGDGRAFLRRAGRLFDVIEADALRPTSAYAGNLYSREYFALVAEHLNRGGFAVTWAPTERIRRTFRSVFPHVVAFDDIYIGSVSPIVVDHALLAKRVADARPYYERAGIDIDGVLRPYLSGNIQVLGPLDDRGGEDVNTDLFPRDEFALPF